jgi:hypothetical protein
MQMWSRSIFWLSPMLFYDAPKRHLFMASDCGAGASMLGQNYIHMYVRTYMYVRTEASTISPVLTIVDVG